MIMITLPEPEIHQNRRHIQVLRDRNHLPGRLVLHNVPHLRSTPSYLLLSKSLMLNTILKYQGVNNFILVTSCWEYTVYYSHLKQT